MGDSSPQAEEQKVTSLLRGDYAKHRGGYGYLSTMVWLPGGIKETGELLTQSAGVGTMYHEKTLLHYYFTFTL